MRIKIRKDLQKRFKQWCKKNDMIPERAANALLNSELEEMFQIIDGDDQPPSESDKPREGKPKTITQKSFKEMVQNRWFSIGFKHIHNFDAFL